VPEISGIFLLSLFDELPNEISKNCAKEYPENYPEDKRIGIIKRDIIVDIPDI
jgi:hypothetical protein